MLGHEEHTVHGQFPRAESESFTDSFVNGHAVLLGPLVASVVLGCLVEIERNQLQVGSSPLVVQGVGLQETAHDDVCVRIVPVLGDDCGNFLGRRLGSAGHGDGKGRELEEELHGKSFGETLSRVKG